MRGRCRIDVCYLGDVFLLVSKAHYRVMKLAALNFIDRLQSLYLGG